MSLERLYQQIELEMLQTIGELIRDGLDLTPEYYFQWRVEQLQKLGVLQERQLRILSKYSGLTVKEIRDYIAQVGAAEVNLIDRAFEREGLQYIVPGNTLQYRLEALETQAADTFNKINSSLLRGSEQIYTDILTKTSAEMLTGNKTLYQAARDAAKQWANLGIPVLTDKAGRQWSAESYTSMVVRNTQKNVANEMQNQRFDDYGMDIVEISQHAGSRPDHQPYQGRRYSRSGKSKEYPPLASTSYGEIDGIVTGINCRHREWPLHPGLNRPIKIEYDAEEERGNYLESQKQRYLERQIRKAKKEAVMLEAMGAEAEDIREANSKVRQRQANMRAFITETGRTRRRQREQIY